MVIFILFFVYSDRGTSQEIPYSVFLNYVDQGLGARNVPSNDPFTANNNGKFKASSLRTSHTLS